MQPSITLDLIIPTYNRENLLRLTLDSVLRAEIPSGLTVRCTVVDNNSKDNTRNVVQEYVEKYRDIRPNFFRYIFEGKQGISHARNTGIRTTGGDWVGMIDDDEEMERNWFGRTFEAIQKSGIDFLAGPYHLKPGVEIPSWATQYDICHGPIGYFTHGDQDFEFTPHGKAQSLGGNIVIKRSILEKVGPYNPLLGRTDRGLLSSEDEDMHERLLASGARGFYLKDLIIFHHCPSERLTKEYHRKWSFGVGFSQGIMAHIRPLECVYVGRIPRYIVRQIILTLPKAFFSYGAELRLRLHIGFIWGCYVAKKRTATALSS